MIAYLSGKIIKKLPKALILGTGNEIGCVGYLVNLPERILETVKENTKIEFFTYTNVREDAIEIFGMQSYEELELFKKLIQVSGVGPKTAQEILSLPIEKIKSAIINEDPKVISSVPKIGKKLAERIILELKNKIDQNFEIQDRTHSGIEEIYPALENLGYNRKEIDKVMQTLPNDIKDPEKIIKFFLQNS